MRSAEDGAPATAREAELLAENARLRHLLEGAGLVAEGAAASAEARTVLHAGEFDTSRAETSAALADATSGRAREGQFHLDSAADLVREDRLQAVLDSAIDYAILTIDPAGLVTSWNVGAERTFGWSSGEVLGRPAELIFTEEDQAAGAPAQEMETALATGRASDERWHRRRDGSRFWGQGALTLLPGGLGYLKVLRDRTMSRRTEERLRESEEFNRRVLAASADCIKVLDLDARLEFMSEGGMCLMEVEDFGAIKGACWPDFWQGEGNVKAVASVEAARRGETGRFEGFATTFKGSPRWWNVIVTPINGPDGRPEKLLSVSRDVTATRRAEMAAREIEARLEFLSELDEALGTARDAPTAMGGAAELLAKRLGASRCAYADVDADADNDRFVIRNDYAVPGVATSVGTYSLDLFGPRASANMRGGQTLVIRDVATELALAEGANTFQAIGIDAIVCCPLVKDGRLVAMMAVHQNEPRDWQDDEVRLVETVVERCWAYVQRVGAEARLRESEARYRALFENIDAGFCVVEVALDTPDGLIDYRVVEANPGFFRQTGFPADILGRWFREAVPGLEDDWFEIYGRIARTGEPERFENEAAPLKRWFELYAFRIDEPHQRRVAILFNDISERKRVAAELEASEERLRLATENAEVGFWDVDTVHDALIWPARTKAMFGISADVPVTMQDFYDGLHPDDREITSAAYAAAADPERRALYDVEYRTVGKEDGLVRWVAAKGRGVFDESGCCLRVVGTAIDISARKAIEEELRELNETLERRVEEEVAERTRTEEALRQAQKMEAVGQLTGGIAHDFNNLLAGIVGSLDLMQTRVRQGRTGEVERYIQAAMTSAQRAAALTHRLLAFSRRQPLDPKPVEANQLVASMEDLLRRTLGPQISLEFVTAGGLWATLCDPHQLENALLNLAINARDAMPEGGKLTIETANAHLDDAYAAAVGAEVLPGQYIAICVTDTGVGMPADVIARAFDPFFTTKPIGEGTGLGLSMIHGFVRQSLGHVRIYSEVGKGTTVKLYLPRYRGAVVEAEAQAGSPEATRADAGETVLVVEDEPVVRGLVVEVLNDLGYRALEAKDGPEALRVLQDGRRRVDLLITDVGLPNGINGRQLADEAREKRSDLKVLFITGYAENAAVANGFLEPGMAMLTKPFAVEALGRKVRDMLQATKGK